MSLPPKPAGLQPFAADAQASTVADALEKVRAELRERALLDVMTDGSRKALAAVEILDAVIRGLKADGDDELLEIRSVATSSRRKRSDEVWDLFDVFFTSADGAQVQTLLRDRRHDDAGDHLAGQLQDAVLVLADFFENLRRHLPPADAFQALRPDVARVLSLALEDDDRDFDWARKAFRAVLRTWGIPAKEVEGMTDFIRKR